MGFLIILAILGAFLFVLNALIMKSDTGDEYEILGSSTLTVIFWLILSVILSVIFGMIGT